VEICPDGGTVQAMTEVSSASIAFDLHTRYLDYRASHPTMDRLLHLGYFRALYPETSSSPIVSREDLEAEAVRGAIHHEVHRALDDAIISRADTVFLTDDLRELVRTAEATMPDEVLFETDIFTPCGFIVMETPLHKTAQSYMRADELDEVVTLAKKYGAVITGTRNNSAPDEDGNYVGRENWEVQAFAWADAKAITPEALSEIRERFGADSEEYAYAEHISRNSESLDAIQVRVFGTLVSTTVDGITVEVPQLQLAPLRLMDLYSFFYGEDGMKIEHDISGVDNFLEEELNETSWERSREVRRFLVALFRLMDEYVDIDKRGLHRAFGKRATRGGRVGDTKNVTVLSLRRALGDDEDGSGTGAKVTLAHLVRGHWRNQWYPSQGLHRAKWIRAHRRGGNAGDEVTARPRIIKVDR
jgi:hypothetical protein